MCIRMVNHCRRIDCRCAIRAEMLLRSPLCVLRLLDDTLPAIADCTCNESAKPLLPDIFNELSIWSRVSHLLCMIFAALLRYSQLYGC
jgi:hypothetical protein